LDLRAKPEAFVKRKIYFLSQELNHVLSVTWPTMSLYLLPGHRLQQFPNHGFTIGTAPSLARTKRPDLFHPPACLRMPGVKPLLMDVFLYSADHACCRKHYGHFHTLFIIYSKEMFVRHNTWGVVSYRFKICHH
jgi:hypothetical protein